MGGDGPAGYTRPTFEPLVTTPPSVLVVGAASRDVTTDDPRGWRLGGAVTYSALTLGRLGFRVRALIGADPDAASARELDLLRAAGVVIALARLESGPVFDNVLHRFLAPADRIPVAALPSHWTSGLDAVLIAPVADEVDEAWASIAGPFLGLGWQGLLRDLVPGQEIALRPPASNQLVESASLVGVSREDFAPDTAATDLLGLLGPGATLAVTDGARGGTLFQNADGGRAALERPYPAIPSDGTVDPTGAGDVFLAAMLGTMVQPALLDGLEDPTTLAAAAASLTIEAPGLFGVPDLADVRRRAARAPSRASRTPSAASSRGNGRPSHA
jgi:sugar/nucleoside kinase (ribokinase family)